MPQEFQVLRCFQCTTFQVHQIKKSNKWVCKLCGEKQSIKKNYGTGTGIDCRLHVQKLNSIRGEILTSGIKSENSEEYDYNFTAPVSSTQIVTKSKWEQFFQNDINSDNNSGLMPKLATVHSDSDLENSDICLGHSHKKKKANLGSPSQSEGQRDITGSKAIISYKSDNYSSIPRKTEVCNSKMMFGSTGTGNIQKNNGHQLSRIVHPAPKMLKDSKWKQFVDVETKSETSESFTKSSVLDNANTDFFALDEENIDELLNSF